jgi:hypothetical protein
MFIRQAKTCKINVMNLIYFKYNKLCDCVLWLLNVIFGVRRKLGGVWSS